MTWWNNDFFDAAYADANGDMFNAAVRTMCRNALRGGEQDTYHQYSGELLIDKDELLKTIEKFGGRKFHIYKQQSESIEPSYDPYSGYNELDDDDGSIMITFDDALIQLTIHGNGNIDLKFVSQNAELTKKLHTILTEVIKKPDDKGHVYIFTHQNNRLFLSMMSGVSGLPLERTNYSTEVIKSYDYIVKNLQSKTPDGKLVLLNGLPGGGKTHLVRGLINDIQNAAWVIVPPSMINSLSQPEFIPVLSDAREKFEEGNKPFIFILEDADSCLVPRGADNMGLISSILNFADGIFGSLFEIRLVATTNARSVEIDPAIMRPGRLCRKVDINHLSKEEANVALNKILGYDADKYKIHDKMMLAEVYKHAKRVKEINEEVEEMRQPITKHELGFRED